MLSSWFRVVLFAMVVCTLPAVLADEYEYGGGGPGTEGSEGGGDPDRPPDSPEPCECEGEIGMPPPVGLRGVGNAAGNVASGMAYYRIDPFTLALRVADRPLSYRAPYGPGAMPVLNNLSYGTVPTQGAFCTTVGSGWTLNFVRFLEIDPADPEGVELLSITEGEPSESHDYKYNFNCSEGRIPFKPAAVTSRLRPAKSYGRDYIEKVSHNEFRHVLTDGTVELYNVADSALRIGWKRLYLKSVTDCYGNAVVLDWTQIAEGMRLNTIKDASGKIARLWYKDSAHPLRVTQIRDPFGRVAQLTYDGNKLLKITDPVGIESEFYYDGDKISTLKTPYGDTTFGRGPVPDANDEIIGEYLEVMDPEHRQRRIEARRVEASEFPEDEVLPAGYTSADRTGIYTLFWTAESGANGLTVANAYAAQWADKNGSTMPAVRSFKAPLTNRVCGFFAENESYVPGEEGASPGAGTISQVQPDNSVRTIHSQQTANGQPESIWDDFGHKVTYSYIPNTRHLAAVDHAYTTGGNTTTTRLVSLGDYVGNHPGQVIDADGAITNYYYNGRGQLERIKNPNNEETKLFYNAHGLPYQVKAAFGTALETVTGLQYDSYDRLWKITSQEGDITTLEYDAINNNPLATLDRLTKVTYPDGKSQRVEWEILHVKKHFDTANRQTTYDHDDNGKVTKVTTWDNKVIEYRHGNCCGGGIDTLVDAAGNKTHWKHDVLGRVTEKWLGWNESAQTGLQVQAIFYDAVGRVDYTMDARGNRRKMNYNAQGQLGGIQYLVNIESPTKPTPDVSFTYEPQFGRLETVTDGTGVTTYGYVPFDSTDTVYGDGALASESKVDLQNTALYTHSYTYDVLGRTLTGPRQSGAQWDALGRLTSFTNALGTEGIHYVGKTGRVDWTTFGPLKTAFTYADAAHGRRATGIWHSLAATQEWVSHNTYEYDAMGRISRWVKYWGGVDQQKIWDIGYNNADELARVEELASIGGEWQSVNFFRYGYDAAGNRTSEQGGGAVRTTSVNGYNQITSRAAGGEMELRGAVSKPSVVKVDGQLATPAGGSTTWSKVVQTQMGQTSSYTIEATETQVPAGLTPQVTTKTLSVDVGNESVAPSYDSDGNLLNDGHQTYEWDAENRLVAVNYAVGEDNRHTEFVYDAFSRRSLITENINGQGRAFRLEWEGLTLISSINTATGGEVRAYYGNGERRTITLANDSTVTFDLFYTRDHLGSIRELVDGSGAIRARYDYDPYGKVIKLSGDLDSDFAFTGHFYHAGSGLHLALYRAYDAQVGKWLSRDPLEEEGGINLYGYVENEPLRFSDPYGLRIDWNTTQRAIKSRIDEMRKIDPVFDQQIKDLEDSKYLWTFSTTTDSINKMNCYPSNDDALKAGKPTGGTINIPHSQQKTIECSDGVFTNEELVAHEVMHAWRMNQGKWDRTRHPKDPKVFWEEEVLAVRAQNRWLKANAKATGGTPNLRKTYGGQPVPGFDE